MKVKFMKKLIAIMCAAVMATSCAVSSVGAVYPCRHDSKSKDMVIEKAKSLNTRLQKYYNLCGKASVRLKNLIDQLKQELEKNSNDKEKKEKIEKSIEIIRSFRKNNIFRVKTREEGVNLHSLLSDIDKTLYDETDVDAINNKLDVFEADLRSFLDRANAISVDFKQYKVLYTEPSNTIELDEDKGNNIEKELSDNNISDYCKTETQSLIDHLTGVDNLIREGLEKFCKTYVNNNVSDADLMKLNQKLMEFKYTRKNFDYKKKIFSARGRNTKELDRAFADLFGPGNSDMTEIRVQEFEQDAQSISKAISLIDNAIVQMKKFIASKAEDLYIREADELYDMFDKNMVDMLAQENLDNPLQWISSEKFKKNNEKFKKGFSKLKNLVGGALDAEQERLFDEFLEGYKGLTNLYCFRDDENKPKAAWIADVKNQVRQLQGQLNELSEKVLRLERQNKLKDQLNVILENCK